MPPPKQPLSAEEQQRAELVSSLLRLVKEWGRVFEQGPAPRAALDYFRSRSRELQAAARGVGFGGIAHHLEGAIASCEPPLDVARVRGALDNVREITLQVRDELGEAARELIDREVSPSGPASAVAPAGSLEPPPFLTVHPSIAPRFEPAAPERRSVAEPDSRLVESTLASARDAVLAPAQPSVGVFRRATTPLPPRREEPEVPNVSVRTMFGLRAFGRGKKPELPAELPPAAPKESSFLGLGLNKQPSRMPSRTPSRSDAPPPLLSSPLPPLSQLEAPPSYTPSLPPARERERERPRVPTARPEPERRDVAGKRRAPSRVPRERSAPPAVGRWLAGFAAVGLAIIVGAVLFVVRRTPASEGAPLEVTSSASPAPSSSGADTKTAQPAGNSQLPRSRLLTDDEQFRSLLSQLHGRGGKESPELRALLEEQAATQAQLLKAGKCDGKATCSEFEKARQLLIGGPTKPIQRRRRPTATPAWMSGLRMPEGLQIEDDPLVKRYFQQYAENRVGRETLQSMLFRCGAYRDLIRATLVRYDIPEAALALVLVESGCEPMARSPVGALGMFQLMPDTGRGYGLRVVENVLDERLSPTKSTEAGVRFLSDLYAKLGSWDLTFAAYNLGPFGLLARIQKAGGDVGFWDLVDADMLPDETAQYVPRIEALALILANLQRLRFAGLQMRAPEDTSDLEVPSGTRLGLVARAASTNLDTLRRMNRDILGDRVPPVPSGRFVLQVPASVVEQARETLADLRTSGNEEDTCVPSSFDWGRQRFTPEMAAACRKKIAETEPEAATPPPP